MGDINQINDVAAANINQVNDVAKANISEINDQGVPASGATNWVVAGDDGHVFWCGADPTGTWTEYDNWQGDGTPRAYDIAAGKDANGNIIYVMSRDSINGELQVSGSNVESSHFWTKVTIAGSGDQDQYRIIWCDDGSTSGVWLAVGRQANPSNDQNNPRSGVQRSTDGGANWTNIALSGLTDHDTSKGIQALCFGNGVAMMAQEDRIYTSTDYGANWSVSTPFANDNPPTAARCLVYTNSTFVLICGRLGELRIRSCADSDLTDWSGESTANTSTRNPGNTFEDTVNCTAANGRVAHVTTNDDYVSYFDVNGKTISNINVVDLPMNAQRRAEDIETDGVSWLISSRLGDIWRSTDNAESWTKIKTDAGGNADHGQAICSNVLLPL